MERRQMDSLCMWCFSAKHSVLSGCLYACIPMGLKPRVRGGSLPHIRRSVYPIMHHSPPNPKGRNVAFRLLLGFLRSG
jgi:hypothetical protein